MSFSRGLQRMPAVIARLALAGLVAVASGPGWTQAIPATPPAATPGTAAPQQTSPAIDARPAASAKLRPKIGLVLSGGGARGLTHVGVLKVLHQLRIPVDYIAATSMGAIVGGLYASGMTPAEMERQLEAVSWPTLLSDSPPRQDVGFRRKEEQAAFPLSFELGYRDGELRWFKGALSGNNLELFLHDLTRRVDIITDFDKLPIPYRAVATNMVTGKEVIFDSGRLYQAMRASMSVPGMFAPVDLDGKILGDGGLVNNLPVDVVRAMGADIVIAVNIGTPLASRDQLSSVVGFAAQMINILTEQNVRTQLSSLRPTDILISPDLGDLTFIDFASAPRFIELGTKAALAASPQLTALAATSEQYAAFEQRMVVPERNLPAKLDFVNVEGTRYANPQVLEDQMETRDGDPFNLRVLEKDIARLYGRGDFEQIDYQLVAAGKQQGLVIKVTEKSWGPNYLRFGLSLASDLQGEATFNMLVGHKRAWVNSWGGEWTNELILGSTRRYATEFYQPLSLTNFLFASAYGLVQRAPEYIFNGDARVATYDFLTESAGIDVGMPLGTQGEIRLGPTAIHYRGDPAVASPEFPTVRSTETGVRLLVRWDGLDHAYFPRHGVRADLQAFVGQREVGYRDPSTGAQISDTYPTSRASVTANAAVSLTRDSFLNVAVRAGAVEHEQISVFNDFNLGGFLQLSGLRTDQLTGNYVGFGRAVYYHQIAQMPLLGRGIYVGGSIEAGNTWLLRENISVRGLRTAGSVFLAADTWLGPFYVGWGRASGGETSFYVYLGRP